MELVCRRKNSSGEGFSFPSTPVESQDSEFEFGCLTPDSPSGESAKDSPADHLFFNGRLLPHSFPCKTANTVFAGVPCTVSRRTSSVSSKDSLSLMSSRSNSTNSSRSSSCSSARTSLSDISERSRPALLIYQSRLASKTANNNHNIARERSNGARAFKVVAAQVYGSQRWQFITPPVPSLSREGSCSSSSSSSRRRRKLVEGVVKEEARCKKERINKNGVCRKFLSSFWLSCMQCHAMELEPSRRESVC